MTQQFNTTTSMGRLTLNVLLSFAQFEREVTSERIRDKIAASKRKGLWVGGMVPLGYQLKEGKLLLVEQEAEQVRTIFRRYLELGSVNRLVADLRERNFRTKIRNLSTGGTRGGVAFTQGPQYQEVAAKTTWAQAPRYIIRDRDGAYGDVLIRRLRAMGIRDRPIAPRSPWQNGHTERLIGSIRRDCLDHVVVFGERHLRHLLGSYQRYYNDARTHLSLKKDTPASRAVQAVGRIVADPHLGGLHHQYVRI